MRIIKRRGGRRVTWTSATLSCEHGTVKATIKQELVDTLKSDVDDCLAVNVVPDKKLRTLVGRAVHVASLIFTWTPFISMLWAPLCLTSNREGGPAKCVWRKQLQAPLLWTRAFLGQQAGPISRIFDVWTHYGALETIEIVVDASPWGLGGVLSHSGRPQEYFGVALSDSDVEIRNIERGNAAAQQAVEALALLVAPRLWRRKWIGRRGNLLVKADSVTSLTFFDVREGQRCDCCATGEGGGTRRLRERVSTQCWRTHSWDGQCCGGCLIKIFRTGPAHCTAMVGGGGACAPARAL